VREEVEQFFASYRDAYNSGDAAAVARHIAVPSLLVQQETTLWATDEQLHQAMSELVAFYARSGFASAHFTVERLLPQGESHAAADVAWTIERSEGRPIWRFRTGYNLRRNEGVWRIVCCTAYEEVGVRQHIG
jgi:ketosteroid isomerase-like protein